MKILKRINGIRGALMRRMTMNIGVLHLDRGIDLTSKADIKRILICRPNHRLGNLLLVTPLLQEVIEIFPLAKIDLFVKGSIAHSLFQNYANIYKIIQLPRKPFGSLLKYLNGWITIRRIPYDIVINAVDHSSSGRLSTQFANSKYRFFGDINEDIANTEVFIGADSGMMHLASAVQTPTVGLFQKTNLSIYEPYNHNSVAINTGISDNDECIRILNRILFHY